MKRTLLAACLAVATAGAAAAADMPQAQLGKPAPDFTLTDLDGNEVKLADLRGKVVVLEWFNPECPFVRFAHTKGPLKALPASHADKGVVWLAINSGAAGKQGTGTEKNASYKKEYGMGYPVLLDESGKVGRMYGAKTTPHMFVIDKEGTLVYRGGVDNAPLGEVEGEAEAYVDLALAAVAAGKPVAKADTMPYGCSVKYGS